MRLLVTEHAFCTNSRETIAALCLDKLERGPHILQAYENLVRADK